MCDSNAGEFDNFLNYGKGRTTILDKVHLYQKFDERFKTSNNFSRGTTIFQMGHIYVNFAMYLIFEKNKIQINKKEMILCYKKKYNFQFSYSTKQISNPFEKFLILLVKRYVYECKNEPIYIKKFDYSIKTLPISLQKIFIENKINKFYFEIKKYLLKNKNLLNLE
jgi:hypothetical protein